MNELDAELTKAGLDTRIVFICYVDTAWPPLEERLDNPGRFSLLVAPITRDYTVPVSEDASDVTYPPYKRNQNVMFRNVDQFVKVGMEWQERCNVKAMLYEYHFYTNQYFDPGIFNFAKNLYKDIINYKKNGLNGLINDCSQRCYFPNGFAFYIYGQLQFDTSLKYEDLLEDYFSHAYGDDWREVVKIFERIGEAISYNYICGKDSADLKVGKRYNPAAEKDLRKMAIIAEDTTEFLEAHRGMPMRAQTVAYKLLRYYMKYCLGLSECLIIKCKGQGEAAMEAFKAFLADFETITDNIGSEYGKKMSEYSKNILKDAWLATLPMVGVYFSGKLVGDALKRIREPMLMFAVTHIYLNHLDAFIKE